jgi:multiple antibiotic resistance protein
VIDIVHQTFAVTSATILVVGALFPIVNPLGSAAIFLNMLGGDVSEEIQGVLARKITIYSFFLLIGSLLWGVKVLSFFGISIYAVQIGGGLVVAATGWSLLAKGTEQAKSNHDEDPGILEKAFYPFTLPITVGPGSISVAITLGAHLPAELSAGSVLSPRALIASLVGIIVVCLIIYICYRYARAAEKLLGATGTSVFMRLSSFIMLCIGIQILCAGVKAYLGTMPR